MTKRSEGRTILVVEDDPVTGRIVTAVLRGAGHVVRTAQDAATARSEVLRAPPQLIISDLNLPDEDGLHLLASLRHNPALPFIPAIVISARDQKPDVLRGLETAEDYIRKPIDPAELLARVAAATRLKDLHDRTAANVRFLSNRVMEIQEEERGRFAREIHDALGSSLLTLKLLLQTAFRDLDPKRLHEDRRLEILDLVDGTAESARAIAHALSPVSLATLGLVPALRELVAAFRRAAPSVTLHLRATGNLENRPIAWNQELYRLVQEAISNSIRHSGSSRVQVTLRAGTARVTVVVRDTGRGFDLHGRAGGLGILLMHERARRMGGQLRLSSAPDAGTEVRFECTTEVERSRAGPRSKTQAGRKRKSVPRKNRRRRGS